MANWKKGNLQEGFNIFAFTRIHQKRLRTSNTPKRLSHENNRCSRVVRVFPNEGSCLRLVSAILMEFSEDWNYGRTCLNMENTQAVISGKCPWRVHRKIDIQSIIFC
ncbi:MAG: hypothetical protein GX603_08185 [Chloroflexi bacterium]|nr:hypothetical protein [Chloroflexota bacterium]